MKHYQKIQIGILCLFSSFTTLYAQEEALAVFLPSADVSLSSEVQLQLSPKQTTTVNYRHHKKLSVTYSGIVIELITSDLPIPRGKDLFQQFGNIYYDQLTKGRYSYCILTDYKNAKKARNYMKRMILPRAPNAKVVKYRLGKRKL